MSPLEALGAGGSRRAPIPEDAVERGLDGHDLCEDLVAGPHLRDHTLDALHLATALYLAEHRRKPRVATYDGRMARAAKAVGLDPNGVADAYIARLPK